MERKGAPDYSRNLANLSARHRSSDPPATTTTPPTTSAGADSASDDNFGPVIVSII